MPTNLLKNVYSDEDFLATTVSSIEFLSKAAPQQIIAIKNAHLEHVFCSEYFLQLMGKSKAEILGKKVFLFLYDNDINFETIFAEEDQMVINSREPKMILKINKFSMGLVPYLCIKSPLINPSTQHVVGILFQGFGVCAINLNHYIKKSSLLLNKKINTNQLPHLSKREKQIIFFFMAHLSSQEIAEALYKVEGKKISKSTIDSLFNDQLYIKFNVYNRSALYKKLQELGYEQKIPKELLASTSIMLDELNTY